MPRYDFVCVKGHRHEEAVTFGVDETRCPRCSAPARRDPIPSRVHVVGVAVPPMKERPIPVSRFLEAHDDMLRDARKSGEKPPDVLGQAKRQARLIRKHAPEMVEGT